MTKSKDLFLEEQMALAADVTRPTRPAISKQTFVGRQLSTHYAAADKLYAIQEAAAKLSIAKRNLEAVTAEVAPAMQPYDQGVSRANMAVLDAKAKLYKLNSDYVDTLFSLVEAAIRDEDSPSKPQL